jgi:thiol-disulfide isomerase/thioredoxin
LVDVTRTLLAAVLSAALLAGCSGTSGKDPDGASDYLPAPDSATGLIAVGERRPAPKIAGEDLDGADLDVATLKGKVVVLNFWASWCAPCNAEAPVLNDVYETTKASGVEFVGVNIKDDRNAALAFERGKQVAYPSLYDQPASTLLRFRKNVPQNPPSTMLLDRQGRIAALFVGAVTINRLTPVVQALAAEPA